MTLPFFIGGGTMIERLEKQIYKKIDKEYSSFINEMLKLSKEEIINNAYKIAVIGEFKEYSINVGSNIIELKALSQEQNILQTFYRNWLKYDDVSLDYVASITIEKITDRYMNLLKEKMNSFSNIDLVKDICEVLNLLDDNNDYDFIKEKFNVEEFSDEIVYLIINDRKGIQELYSSLSEVNINDLTNDESVKNKIIGKNILPKLKDEIKIKETIER